jgi:hypothetical protein
MSPTEETWEENRKYIAERLAADVESHKDIKVALEGLQASVNSLSGQIIEMRTEARMAKWWFGWVIPAGVAGAISLFIAKMRW